MSQNKLKNHHTLRFAASLICSNPPEISDGPLKGMYNTAQLLNFVNKVASAPAEQKLYILTKTFGRKFPKQGTISYDPRHLLNNIAYTSVDLNKVETITQAEFDLLNTLFTECNIPPVIFGETEDTIFNFANIVTGRKKLSQPLNNKLLDFLTTCFYLLWDAEALSTCCQAINDHDQLKYFHGNVDEANLIYNVTLCYTAKPFHKKGEMYVHLKKISDLLAQADQQRVEINQLVDKHNKTIDDLNHVLSD